MIFCTEKNHELLSRPPFQHRAVRRSDETLLDDTTALSPETEKENSTPVAPKKHDEFHQVRSFCSRVAALRSKIL